MSRIDDLINRLCPDGVAYRTLGEVGEFIRGNGLQKSDLTDKGVPAIHYGQVHTTYGAWVTETVSFITPALAAKLRKARPGDIVIATTSEDDQAVGKAMAWVGGAEAAVSGDAYIYRHSLVPKFVAYFFQTDYFQNQKKRWITGTKVRRISGENLAKVRIPVPPDEVQREVVAVLDALQNRQAELEAELQAELGARRRQYAFYRDDILALLDAPGVPRIPMGELGEIFRGKRFTKADYVDEGGVGCIHYGEIYTDYGTSAITAVSRLRSELAPTLRFASRGDVVLTDVGETVEDVGKAVAWLGSEDVAVHDHCYVFRSSVNPLYVSHYMTTKRFRADKERHIARTKVKTLLPGGLSKILMPVPSPDEQERIVAILEEFDALVGDLSSGLSSELRARRIQYEFYRNELLTFEEIAA